MIFGLSTAEKEQKRQEWLKSLYENGEVKFAFPLPVELSDGRKVWFQKYRRVYKDIGIRCIKQVRRDDENDCTYIDLHFEIMFWDHWASGHGFGSGRPKCNIVAD